MGIPEADAFLTERKSNFAESIRTAFHFPIVNYPAIGTTVEEVDRTFIQNSQELMIASSVFFTTGVSFLANRSHSPFFQELGQIAWWEVSLKNSEAFITNDMIHMLKEMGLQFDPGDFTAGSCTPYVSLSPQKTGGFYRFRTQAIFPTQFIVEAQENPLIALAELVYWCSTIRDAVSYMPNGGPRHYGEIEVLASAVQAKYLREATSRIPGVRLPLKYIDKMRDFPEETFARFNYQFGYDFSAVRENRSN